MVIVILIRAVVESAPIDGAEKVPAVRYDQRASAGAHQSPSERQCNAVRQSPLLGVRDNGLRQNAFTRKAPQANLTGHGKGERWKKSDDCDAPHPLARRRQCCVMAAPS